VATSFLDSIVRTPAPRCELRNTRTDHALATRVEPAFDSASRRKGLLGRDGLQDDCAIILAPCNAIHTFFMRFPIDVVFVSRTGMVISISRAVAPWRIRVALRAFAAVELPAGTADRHDTRIGDAFYLSTRDA
jgi:hypothetical protein